MMLRIFCANFSTSASKSNSLYFDNIQNQIVGDHDSFVLELTSFVSEETDSCRITSTNLNRRFMTSTFTAVAGTPDKTAGQLKLGTNTLPFGLYGYRIGFQNNATNTDIANTTIIQRGIAIVMANGGQFTEVAGNFVEYSDTNDTYAYTG
jgi:hypothetical protein